MEKIKHFLKNNEESGNGAGNGSGSGNGDGYGYGSRPGYGNGYSNGRGTGNGSGSSSGLGSDFGSGSGSGWGSDWCSDRGWGEGSGSGSGDGIKTFNGNRVYMVDGIATIITNARGNLAKGFIINGDLTLEPCYVVKRNNLFAHGKTLEKARIALQEKIYASMSTEQVIEAFLETFSLTESYPAREFYEWHGRLTGSCEMGRNQFAEDHNINLDRDKLTVQEFIELTQDAYGGDVIKHLAKRRLKR